MGNMAADGALLGAVAGVIGSLAALFGLLD